MLVEIAVGTAGAQQGDRLVVGDPVQPRTQRDLPRLARERAQRLDHRVLQRIRGVVAVAENRVAVAMQRPMMALEDRGHRALAARSRQPRQAGVGRQPKLDRGRTNSGAGQWGAQR
jgi:uncharacterized membrane protein YdbT with pleckstrin-like domain